MNRKSILIGAAITITLILLYSSCSVNTYMGRWIKWRQSDIEDYKKFPSHGFEASPAPFRFIEAYDSRMDAIKVTKKGDDQSPLIDILENSGTTAFIIIKNDTILYERYLNGYKRESENTSFSVAKSITSLMIGKAIDENIIHSVDDPVTRYIPDLEQTDAGYDRVKISHLLDMRSGIQFKDHDLPWGDKPKAYYHPSLRNRIMELPLMFEPGSEFQYNSYNPILAGMILEKASGVSPAKYFEQKIWNELGMEYAGSWSLDSHTSGMTKMESGINLRAIDFAKFGRLVINKGNWNGKQVIAQNWMDYSFDISPDYHVEEFGEEIYYKNFWWMYSKDQERPYIISGWGHLGQYLYIFPDKHIIIVRMGKKTGSVGSWGNIFKELVAVVE